MAMNPHDALKEIELFTRKHFVSSCFMRKILRLSLEGQGMSEGDSFLEAVKQPQDSNQVRMEALNERQYSIMGKIADLLESSINAGLSYPATIDALKEEGQKLLHELHNPPDSLVWGERGK